MLSRIVVLALCCLTTSLGTAQANVSPSHVYQQTRYIIDELQQLRRFRNIDTPAREPSIQIRKLPAHVYGKGLELLEKLIRFQQSLGLSPQPLPKAKIGKVTPGDVFQLTVRIREDIQAISNNLGLTLNTPDIALKPGKLPSDVYESMWRASYLMDGLTKPIAPAYVLRNLEHIGAELTRIANQQRWNTQLPEAPEIANKKPFDVTLLGFHALYHMADLQKKLNMPPTKVSTFPDGKITPSDAYDTTNNLQTEVNRVKAHLGLTEHIELPALKDGITPTHVYRQMWQVAQLLKLFAQ